MGTKESKLTIKTLLIVLIQTFLLPTTSQSLTFPALVSILQQTNKSPFVNMYFIYDSSTETGKQLEQFVPLVTASKREYYKVHLLDCNTDDQEVIKSFPFCSQEYRPTLPALMFTQPSLNPYNSETGEINQAKQHQYQGKLDEKALFDFALPLMRAFSTELKKVKDWQKFTQRNKDVPTLLYFTDKEKLPTIYKTLTAHFRNTIAFGHVMKDSPLANHFNITKFPTMLLNGKQQIVLLKNLKQMIEKLDAIKGEQTNIVIEEYQSSTKEQLNMGNIQKLVYELPEHILVHVGDESGLMHPQWKKCKESFRKMFTYYETVELAKEFGVKQTPAIVYFPKSLVKKQVQKTIFSPKESLRNIYDQLSSLIEDFTVPLSNDAQMQKLTSIPLLQGKFVAVLFHEDQISLSYRMLSNDEKYKKDIVFFRMKDPDPALMEKFQLKKLPALYIMENEASKENDKNQEQLPEGKVQMNLKIAQYTGKFNYDDLTRYFNMFSKQQKPAQQTSSQENNSKPTNLVAITSQKAFKKHCLQSSCYILLLDGRSSKKETNENSMNEVKKIASTVHESITAIDATCHSEIIAPLQIQQEQLPIFIYFNSKFEKFTRLIGRIQEKSLNLFVSKVKSNKANYRGYEKFAFNDKKNCTQQHRKLDDYENGGSSEQVLSETQKEILKEIQEEEERKKQEMQKNDKEFDKNDKKKRRKRRPKNQNDFDLEDL